MEEMDYEYEYEMEDDEESVDYGLLMELKKKYFDIYQTEIDGVIFTYRSIGFSEYDAIRTTIPENEEREEAVCRAAVLDPLIDGEGWSEHMYGVIPQMLAVKILQDSLLTQNTASEVKRYRLEQEVMMDSSVEHQLALLIKEVFPEYTFEEILSWSLRKMCRFEAYAKWTMKNLRGMQMEDGDPLEKQLEIEKMQAGQ